MGTVYVKSINDNFVIYVLVKQRFVLTPKARLRTSSRA